MPYARIIATLGPATDSVKILSGMAKAGMDMARLNFSHGSLREHLSRLELLRSVSKKKRRRIAVLGDLEGHRIRIGNLAERKPVAVNKGETLWLTKESVPGKRGIIPFDYQGSLRSLKKGTRIYIDDGTISLEVITPGSTCLKAKVIVGGRILERKGVNIPGVHLPFEGLTPKDTADILFSCQNGIDFIAQSFVRNKQDILDVRKELEQTPNSCKVIAKIENWEGIRNIDSILSVSDGIMIARGDMGISIPLYEVPMVQKMIIRKCNAAKKPVITATQMLESMTSSPTPTRAEVSDVANAIIDGSDYVMLSAETAVGTYPVETVDIMERIIAFTEKHGKKP